MVARRKALESQWQGVCTVMVREEQTNQVTKRTEFNEVELVSGQPCKLSFKTIASASPDGNVMQAGQAVKLFIASGLDIPPGSKIIVTQNGVTTEYARSGAPAVYTCHQEIMLEPFKGWA